MGAMASQITRLTIVYPTVYSGADQSKHQSSASLAFVWGILDEMQTFTLKEVHSDMSSVTFRTFGSGLVVLITIFVVGRYTVKPWNLSVGYAQYIEAKY